MSSNDCGTVTVNKKYKTVTVSKPTSNVLEVHDAGVAGPPNSLSIGTVTVGEASASITGTPPNQVLNLVLPVNNVSTRYVYTQATPSTTWVINHTLGGYPSVSVVDSAKTVVFGEVTYQSTSQVVVNFSTAFSGFAYLT